ncbi:MAG: hypothetical protein HQL45_02800 [Alphaproteobacteria bacterium]|nr:hypothetical protein [Alphaproteobacteria bacterium]
MLTYAQSDRPALTAPSRRHGLLFRLAARLGLVVLSLNLLLGVLLPQPGFDLADGLELCVTHLEKEADSSAQSSGQKALGAPHCVFCLQHHQAAALPERAAQPVLASLAGLTDYPPGTAAFQLTIDPPDQSSPRAPPIFS